MATNKTPSRRLVTQHKNEVSSKPAPTALAPAETNEEYRQRYLDEVAPAGMAGRLIGFDPKTGEFVTKDDNEPIAEDVEFVVLADQTLVGLIKFNGANEPPTRHQGLLYEGFRMPDRNALGDLDKTQWDEGLDGKPSDPWKHQVCLVLQQRDTDELFTFAPMTDTGRRAAGQLLRHYDRTQRTSPGELPIIQLRVGGFNHRDPRVGWVKTPVLRVIGRIPGTAAVKPPVSTAETINDKISY